MKSISTFQRLVRSAAIAAAFSIGFGSAIPALMATPTENYGLRLLPAPRNIAIDGKVEDWNLAGGVLAMDDAAKTTEDFGVWIHGAYDSENLYILARWLDKTPLSNPGDTKLDAGWSGDCLQVRVITNYGDKEKEQRNNLTCWRGKDGADLLELDIPSKEAKPAWYTKNGPAGDNLKLKGAKQALLVNTDGSGYSQELAVPWKYLTKDGNAPKPGESVILTVEPNFTFGENKNRITVKDIFRPGVALDRVFTFRAYPTWGVAKLMDGAATIDPEPVRLADGRTFPVRLEENLPVVDWTGLVESKVKPGWIPVTFTLPEASYVSLHIKNAKGQVVRQLVNGELLPAGANTIMWDGLTTPNWNEPGQALEAGTYTWSAITHPGLQAKLRGVASNAGRVPWDDGKGSNWGGDMGNPVSVDTDGDALMLGWGMAEAGKAAIFTDLEGKPVWGHKRGGIGGARYVALDGGVCYIMDNSTYSGRLAAVYKFTNAMDVVPWTDNNSAERGFKELGAMETEAGPVKGFTVKGGRLYFSTEADGGTVYITDAVSGKFQRKVALAGAGAIAANSKGAYVVSDGGTKLTFIDGATGAVKPVLMDLKNATAVALEGKNGAGSTSEPESIYIGTGAPESCVYVYSAATGKEVRTIGDKGGRADLGVWRATALRNIAGLAVDKKGQLWVAEDEDKP
ncbi:MAG: FlgD immunoglobulin-like domain containing protein, partial [Candidatus Methylacidiphilales bacterium]